MLRKERNGIQWLEFELLQNYPEIVHGTFLRHGGVSPPPYHSLNTSAGSGDDIENVRQNLERIRSELSISHLVQGKQCHLTKVEYVMVKESHVVDECDGLITRESDVGLVIRHADCQAALFYDPVHKVIANVHSGWRGSVQNIYRKAISMLEKKFHSRAKDLIVCISPSLGPNASEFIHYKQEFPPSLWSFQFKENYFNLWEISRHQLLQCGVLPENLEIASICTYTEVQDFFSYRRDKKCGRNATVIALKTQNSG